MADIHVPDVAFLPSGSVPAVVAGTVEAEDRRRFRDYRTLGIHIFVCNRAERGQAVLIESEQRQHHFKIARGEHWVVHQPGILPPVVAAPVAVIGIRPDFRVGKDRVDRKDTPVEFDRVGSPAAAGRHPALQQIGLCDAESRVYVRRFDEDEAFVPEIFPPLPVGCQSLPAVCRTPLGCPELLFPGRDIGCLCGTGYQPQVEMLDRPGGGDLQRRSLDESRAAHPHPESSVQQRIVEPGRERMQFHQVERQRIGRVFVAVVPHHGIGIGQGLVG